MQTKLPKISIVTVVYNDSIALEKTIKSVINQTYDNIEYIIIDGGSSDGTLDIIKKYENRINYWVSEKDEGIYDAMNKGIDVATGEWINFMNAGDVYQKDFILYDVFTKSEYHGGYGLIFLNATINGKKMMKNFTKEAVLKKNVYKSYFCHQSLLFNAKLLGSDNIKYDKQYKIKADRELVTRLIYKEDIPFNILDIDFCIYDSSGVSNVDIEKKEKENITISQNISIKAFSKTLIYSFSLLFIFKLFTKFLKLDWNKTKNSLALFMNK